jgi:hypothetical protein
MAASTGRLDEARERRRGVKTAMSDLERAIAAPASGRADDWLKGVTGCLEELRRAFSYHIEVTEGPDGFLAEIRTHAPRLSHRVGVVTADHATISAQLDRVLRRCEQRAGIEEIRSDALDILNRVARHRHMGADLVYEAFDVDIEGGE